MLSAGDPLSFIGYANGCIEVAKYNGSNYIGISNCNIVKLDLTKSPPRHNEVSVGSFIFAIRSGTVFIPSLKGEMLQYIQPTEGSQNWKVTYGRKKRSIGQIIDVRENGCRVHLL